MANTNAPFGFVPYAPGGGAGVTNFVLRPVQINYSYATNIYKGDPVKMTSTGYINAWTASTGVSQLAGIFWGCEYLSNTLGYTVQRPYWGGSSDTSSTTKVTAYLIPCDLANPMWFLVQSDATGLTQAFVGLNIDVNMGTGSTTTGLSGAYIDTTTTNTTNTLPFKIMRLYSDFGGLDNGSAAGAYIKAYVAANITSSTGI